MSSKPEFEIFDVLSQWVGLSVVFVALAGITFCTLKALISLGKNNLRFFTLFSKAFGLLIGLFGILLLVRGFPWYITVLEIWIATIMGQNFPIMQILQAAITLGYSWYYWGIRLFLGSGSFLSSFCDTVFFLIVPTVFILAQLNYESQSVVSDANPKYYGPRLPLSKFI